MALKKQVSKKEYDKLSDALKEHYKEGEFSDTFVLDTGETDEDDPAELRRAKARETEDRKKAQKDLRVAQARIAELEGEGEGDGETDDETDPPARRGKSGRAEADAKKIDSAWKAKHEKAIGEKDAKLSAKDAFIKKQMVDSTANSIATKISTSPKLLAKAIAERLTVDFDGDEPELIILGEDGKPSGMSLDKLEKEFVANKEYAAIIVGSKASGGGAPKTSPETKTGGGAPASEQQTPLSKQSPKDLVASLKARKASTEA